MHIFGKPDLVTNIKDSNSFLQIATNVGTKETNQIADVLEYGSVCYDQWAIVSNFGWMDRKDTGYQVKYNSNNRDKFMLNMGKNIEFTCKHKGLLDLLSVMCIGIASRLANAIMYLQWRSKAVFTSRQFERAKEAKELRHNLGSPTIEDLNELLQIDTSTFFTLKDVNTA